MQKCQSEEISRNNSKQLYMEMTPPYTTFKTETQHSSNSPHGNFFFFQDYFGAREKVTHTSVCPMYLAPEDDTTQGLPQNLDKSEEAIW